MKGIEINDRDTKPKKPVHIILGVKDNWTRTQDRPRVNLEGKYSRINKIERVIVSPGCTSEITNILFSELSQHDYHNTITLRKNSSIWRFSSPYFLRFGLTTERHRINIRIQSECRKIRTRKTPNMHTFYAMKIYVFWTVWEYKKVTLSRMTMCMKIFLKNWGVLQRDIVKRVWYRKKFIHI